MTGTNPATAPSCRLPALPTSPRRARDFVAGALPGLGEEVLDSVQLLTSELVTNAVLHAQTEVEVRVWSMDGRVHVRVRDDGPGGFVVQDLDVDAPTGRGLFLVESLAADYGVDARADSKTVWFELWPESAAGLPEPEGWHQRERGSYDEITVVLSDMPVGLSRAAERHRAALLREARLAVQTQTTSLGVTAGQLADASRAHSAITNGLARSTRVPGATPTYDTLEMPFPPGYARPVAVLGDVLDALNVAARDGLLLTRPSLPEVSRFRGWMLDEVAGQTEGGEPTPWTPLGGDAADDRQAGALEWRREEFLRRTVPAVAASDDNRVLAINPAAEDLLGWSADDLIGRRVTTLVPPDWRERHVAGFTNFLVTGDATIVGSGVRVPALHHDGRTVPVELTISVEQSEAGRTVFVAELRPTNG